MGISGYTLGDYTASSMLRSGLYADAIAYNANDYEATVTKTEVTNGLDITITIKNIRSDSQSLEWPYIWIPTGWVSSSPNDTKILTRYWFARSKFQPFIDVSPCYGGTVVPSTTITGTADGAVTATNTSITGTADGAVTTSSTSLTDGRISLALNAYIGAQITCNGKTMIVTSNGTTWFSGSGWSGGGTPGNGNAWSLSMATLTDTRADFAAGYATTTATITCNAKTMTITHNTRDTLIGISWSGGSNPGNGNSWSLSNSPVSNFIERFYGLGGAQGTYANAWSFDNYGRSETQQTIGISTDYPYPNQLMIGGWTSYNMIFKPGGLATNVRRVTPDFIKPGETKTIKFWLRWANGVGESTALSVVQPYVDHMHSDYPHSYPPKFRGRIAGFGSADEGQAAGPDGKYYHSFGGTRIPDFNNWYDFLDAVVAQYYTSVANMKANHYRALQIWDISGFTNAGIDFVPDMFTSLPSNLKNNMSSLTQWQQDRDMKVIIWCGRAFSNYRTAAAVSLDWHTPLVNPLSAGYYTFDGSQEGVVWNPRYSYGTANAAVTTTNTSLTDTRLTGTRTLTTDAFIGCTVTCNGKTLTVTSNSGTVLNGSGGWSGGGNPGNGNTWSAISPNVYGTNWATWTIKAEGDTSFRENLFEFAKYVYGLGLDALPETAYDPWIDSYLTELKTAHPALAMWGEATKSDRGRYLIPTYEFPEDHNITGYFEGRCPLMELLFPGYISNVHKTNNTDNITLYSDSVARIRYIEAQGMAPIIPGALVVDNLNGWGVDSSWAGPNASTPISASIAADGVSLTLEFTAPIGTAWSSPTLNTTVRDGLAVVTPAQGSPSRSIGVTGGTLSVGGDGKITASFTLDSSLFHGESFYVDCDESLIEGASSAFTDECFLGSFVVDNQSTQSLIPAPTNLAGSVSQQTNSIIITWT